MTTDGSVQQTVRRLAAQDPLAARLLMASHVTTLLRPHGYRPVVVGGSAVDAYVGGGFGTSESLPAEWEESLDIDTVVLHVDVRKGAPEPRRVLEESGFLSKRPGGGSLRLEDVPFPVDIVGEWYPDDYSREHVTTIHLEDAQELGLEPAEIAGPEDILFDYMASGWDTRHPRDWARALAVAAVMGDQLDLGYLFTKAHWRVDGAFVEPLERVLRGEPLQPNDPSPPSPV